MSKMKLILTSQSPRRHELLAEAGFDVEVVIPPYDDPADPRDVKMDLLTHKGEKDEIDLTGLSGQFACMLAERKLLSLAGDLTRRVSGSKETCIAIAADTVCVDQDLKLALNDYEDWQQALIGKPEHLVDARRMLSLFSNRSHAVVTGVSIAVVSTKFMTPAEMRTGMVPDSNIALHAFWDAAKVHLGWLSESDMETYLATNEWQGKAGAYNLEDRIQAGWPLSIDEGDDPATVMGLPMKKLKHRLEAFQLTIDMMADAI